MASDYDTAVFEVRIGRSGGNERSSLSQLRARIRMARRSAKGPGKGSAKGSFKPSGSSSRLKQARVKQTSVRAHFVKGAKGRERPVSPSQRRVVVKARYVVHGAGRGAPLRAHVAYLTREPRTAVSQAREVERGPDGPGRADEHAPAHELQHGPQHERGETLRRSVDYLGREGVQGSEGREQAGGLSFYNQREEGIDARALTAGWVEDSRHFRLIVSPEDGAELGDLKPFIREVMADLEARLGTKLAWVAVDHHDTDNPHSHVLIRGRRSDGQDLFIPSKLISSGIRERAQEVATRVLGPRLEVDLAKERALEIREVTVTSLDRELMAHLGRGGGPVTGPDLIARLDQLERWDLAARTPEGWRLADGLGEKLLSMRDRIDVEQAVARLRPPPGQTLRAADARAPVLGELVLGKLEDAFGDNFLAVVETGSTELRYARFDRSDDLAVLDGAPRGALLALDPVSPRIRPSDEAVARVAARMGGVYSADVHASLDPGIDPGLVAANIRRLEAMRRAGLVERSRDGLFAIAPDHLDRALDYEAQLVAKAPVRARMLSYWTLDEQVEALGPTHLDRVLAREISADEGEGAFAKRYTAALQQRRLFLIEQGWMGEGDRQLQPSVLRTLADRERADLARHLSQKHGRHAFSTFTPAHVSGVYAERIDLAQGRMAVIVGARQVNIVPWRPALERFAGREVEGQLRGSSYAWRLSRGRSISLPPMV